MIDAKQYRGFMKEESYSVEVRVVCNLTDNTVLLHQGKRTLRAAGKLREDGKKSKKWEDGIDRRLTEQ